MKLKKGDKIIVFTGKDRGREGTVERTYPKQKKITVTGINLVKKHIQKTEQTPQGGVVEVPRPFMASNVRLICPKCKKHSTIGYSIEKGRKMRICKKCKSKI